LKIPDLKTDILDDIKMLRITCFTFILSLHLETVTRESVQKLMVKIDMHKQKEALSPSNNIYQKRQGHSL